MVSLNGCLGLLGLGTLAGETDVFGDRVLSHTFQKNPGFSGEESKDSIPAFMLGYNKEAVTVSMRGNDTASMFGEFLIQEMRKKKQTAVSELELRKHLIDHAGELSNMNDGEKIMHAARALGAHEVIFCELNGDDTRLVKVTLVYFSALNKQLVGRLIITFRNPETLEEAAKLIVKKYKL